MRSDVAAAEVERFGEILGDWARANGEPVLLSWLGGEPFLWPALLDVSAKLREKNGLSISATTNGSTLHRTDVRRSVLENFAELTVSVDGLAPRHDAVRRAPGSWARTEKAVKALVQERQSYDRRIKLRANIVVMRDTIGEFRALCRILAEWGIDEITFNQLGGRDRPEFYPANRLLPDDAARFRAMLPEVTLELAARQVRICAHPDYLDRIVATTLGSPLPIKDCGPGENFLFIDENCILAPCSFTVDSYGVATNQIITADDFAHLPDRFRIASGKRRSRECDDCPSTQTFSKFAA
jgi:MoaA/NifB/PqqE/SkfB family radical SAM enzyme